MKKTNNLKRKIWMSIFGITYAISLIFYISSCNSGSASAANSQKANNIVIQDTARSNQHQVTPQQAVSVAEIPKENEVFIKDKTFDPAVITVVEGTNVKWINKNAGSHGVVSDKNAYLNGVMTNNHIFNSGRMNNNGFYEYKFVKAGTYTYHCTSDIGMTAKVIVTKATLPANSDTKVSTTKSSQK
jgi:plastocyanin